MFRRAVSSLLARRFSPRATPTRAVPARSLHCSRDHAIGEVLFNVYIGAACASAGGGFALALHHFMKGTGVGESAAGKVIRAWKEVTNNNVKYKKPDMNERFERWIMKNDKTYRDEEEKAMRFQLFKATVEWIESHDGYFQEISYFADFTKEEEQCMMAYPDGFDWTEYDEFVKAVLAKQEKGEPLIMRPDVKQGDTQATQVSS